MTNETHVNFDEQEEHDVAQAKKNKTIWLGEPGAPFKKRLYQFIATIVTTLLVNFSTKLAWQFGLIMSMLITMPIGAYVSIKWIYHLFF